MSGSRKQMTNFLIKYEIFQRILPVHGSIIEGGVGAGDGLLTWAYLSSILEPVNHTRRVIGFDTFAGFPSVSKYDRAQVGEMNYGSAADLEAAITEYDHDRPVSHIPKIELVKGDACQTIPPYVRSHPHLVVALLYLDFDLYDPTHTALTWFRDRMPQGAVIAFDELNVAEWPGETLALMQCLRIPTVRLERCAFGSTICWAQL